MHWEELTLHKDFGGLGFGNMEAFNFSMLGKQGWKLLIEPNPLLSRILKAKYFPQRDFLEADIGHNPSNTWRSIWSSQSLLSLGHRWKIADDLTVSHLKISDLMSWKAEVIDTIFSPTDAAAILGIHLTDQNLEDKCAWKASHDGIYTVKSAYRMCMIITMASSTLTTVRSGGLFGIWTSLLV
ncbi:ribonuclease H [Trifolium pratense]|uniref:Ribonuclease H n=1 Tax=Trifolium pratense TaxID=57577 RepID=A0A2K3PDY8_TRIPR|nr:ribonuclease H [Trifolium pratense]